MIDMDDALRTLGLLAVAGLSFVVAAIGAVVGIAWWVLT